MSQRSIIELNNISKVFGNSYANKNVELKINKGEILSILGENGAGKTTLMRILTGIYSPDSGEILYKGENILPLDPEKARTLSIGMVHQHFLLMDNLQVWENIVLGNEEKILLDKKKIIEKIRDIEEQYSLKVDPEKFIRDIGIGLKQQVELLKLLYRDFDILIFDEPTALLIPEEIESLYEIFKKLRLAGKSIIFITHKLDEIFKIADRVVTLSKGEILGDIDIKNTSKNELINLLFRSGKRTVNPVPDSDFNGHLTISYANVKGKLNIKDLNIRAGEVFGIAGIEGNGQKTLFDLLFKIIPGEKRVVFNGKDITNDIRDHIALIPEDRHHESLILQYDLKKNFLLNSSNLKESGQWGFIQEKRISKKVRTIVNKMNVKVMNEEENMENLSGGNQQKFILGRELLGEKAIIIAKNPTRGLDFESTNFVHNFIIKKRNEGKVILLISTELEELMKISDRLGVIFRGRIIKVFEKADFNTIDIGNAMLGLKEN